MVVVVGVSGGVPVRETARDTSGVTPGVRALKVLGRNLSRLDSMI